MNPVQMTAKLYDARDTAKRLLGHRYSETMVKFGAAIASVAKGKGIEPLAAMTLIARTAMDEGNSMAALYVMAACVELVEGAA